MRKTMAPTRSVHFIDSETISKQIFTPARYNLPLFLCKKLNVRSTSAERNTKQQCARKLEQASLFQRMAKYHVNELTKDRHEKKSSPISQPQPPSGSAGHARRRCSTHRFAWPDCPRPLRDGRKEWCLPPGRYRLGGSLADLANQSTGGGSKAVRDGPTKGGFGCGGATGPNSSQRHPVDINTINLPAEMNKLLHPRKYFVGKIRPGDRMTDRPTLRLALSEPTVCYRDPNHPGPGNYDPEKAQLPSPPGQTVSKQRPLSPCCYTYDLYCRESFFRPPPGRYDIRDALPPLASDQSQPITVQPIPPIRYGKATIRLNSIDIPVRPRKGRRNMKVAFLSGTARFRDRDFMPIGGLGKAMPAGGSFTGKRLEKQQEKTPAATSTSKRSASPLLAQTSPPRDWLEGAERVSTGGERSATSRSSQVEQMDGQPEGEDTVGGKAERARVSEDLVQVLVTYGISRGDLPPLSRHKIPTKFFTVPKLARTGPVALV
uniref:Uncharacterized protein n=1 Tax=Anopheles quadriannulatus TaxID=34691 RepID=A0A904A3F2_ANOQN